MKTLRKVLPFLIATASITSTAFADAPVYTLTDLGSPQAEGYGPYGFYTVAGNTSGAVIGDAYDGYTHLPFYYYNGHTQVLGTLGGDNAYATAIGGNGNIVGTSSITGNNESHAFYYDGVMHDLGTLGGAYSVAGAINNRNQIVGSADRSDGASRAFLYDTEMRDLGALGGTYSAAGAINNNGVIVGVAQTTNDTEFHAFMFDTSMHDLGTLGGTYSEAMSISSNNLIVGISNLAGDNTAHAFLYDGTLHDLGTLGGSNSNATGVNRNGWIIGGADTENGMALYLYDGTKMYDINTLITNLPGNISLSGLLSIDDNGNIIAYGNEMQNGIEHIYQLTAVPIPGSASLLGSCLTGLIGLRRKFKNT